MKKRLFLSLVMGAGMEAAALGIPSQASAIGISNVTQSATSVRVYEKYEVRFQVNTSSQYPFFQYDENPPPGVAPKSGVSVEGVFTSPSGKILKQPAFYTTEVNRTDGNPPIFTETNKKYWVVRFAPQEKGTYQASLSAQDSSGTTTAAVGNFTATDPSSPGFIKVSKNDSRYFEFSNGQLFWPIGPAWGTDYAKLSGTGQNLERPWMAGRGAYSTNWARWLSSAEQSGNEGRMTRLTYKEHYPGHDLAYELFYPEGSQFWMTVWDNECCGPRLKTGQKYQVKLTYKTANLTGPRIGGQPWGLVVKNGDAGVMFRDHTIDQFDEALRAGQVMAGQITSNQDWATVTATFNARDDQTSIFAYLENVSSGQAYIDELSVREVLADGSLGSEIIRNPRADMHTYVDPRGAAFLDWQVEQGEKYGVYFKYVVHDKNDWIQAHLKANGQFADVGEGYYQDENTKARWLLRQWYRYLAARYGYSTAIHSWELNNEGPPNEDPAGSGTAPHWRTAQAFAKYMHTTDVHPHLVSTSFWCCWRPEFWGSSNFPDIDYADIHEYTNNIDNSEMTGLSEDLAEWTKARSLITAAAKVGKPVIRGETGVTNSGGAPMPELTQANAGIWYHNLLWAELNSGGMSDPNYWFSEHINKIDKQGISKPFYLFIKDTDLNGGGYQDLAAQTTNSKLRWYGQKNLSKNEALGWIQNSDHTWKKYLDGVRSQQSGNINFVLNPNTVYTVQWWNTGTGTMERAQQLTSGGNGAVSLAISNLTDDTAFKITSPSSTTPALKPGDATGDGVVNGQDYAVWLTFYGKTTTAGYREGNFNSDTVVDGKDYLVWLTNYGK